MEILKDRLYNIQKELEDAFRIETTYAEAKSIKYGRKLLNYLRKRRRIVVFVLNVLDRI